MRVLVGCEYSGVVRRAFRALGHDRVAWELVNGPIPDGLDVLHRCDNRACVNVERCLFLGTHVDNMADMKAKGRGRGISRPGAASPMAKLTWAAADAIRAAPRTTTNRQLATEHRIDPAQVSRIRAGLVWVRGG